MTLWVLLKYKVNCGVWLRRIGQTFKSQPPNHFGKPCSMRLRLVRGTRFFDAGCGGGGASNIASQRGAIISGIDASDALIVIARERIPQGRFPRWRLGELAFFSRCV